LRKIEHNLFQVVCKTLIFDIMALKTSVYVTGIANLTDARYCAGMGVDYLGFNFDPEQGPVIDKAAFFAIVGWLAGVKVVAECGNLDWNQVERIVAEYEPQAVATSNLQVLNQLRENGTEAILAWNIDDLSEEFFETIKPENAEPVMLLLKAMDWQYPDDFTEETISTLAYTASISTLILGCKTEAELVTDMLEAIQPNGIMLKGTDEIKPGVSELDELAEILEKLEEEDY
jgi:phosphoribosylanthranilate isomerase